MSSPVFYWIYSGGKEFPEETCFEYKWGFLSPSITKLNSFVLILIYVKNSSSEKVISTYRWNKWHIAASTINVSAGICACIFIHVFTKAMHAN